MEELPDPTTCVIRVNANVFIGRCPRCYEQYGNNATKFRRTGGNRKLYHEVVYRYECMNILRQEVDGPIGLTNTLCTGCAHRFEASDTTVQKFTEAICIAVGDSDEWVKDDDENIKLFEDYLKIYDEAVPTKPALE